MSRTKFKVVPVFRNGNQVLSDEEVLRAKRLLRVDEVATILRVSQRHVRYLVDEGRLHRYPEKPLRISASSVAAYLLAGDARE